MAGGRQLDSAGFFLESPRAPSEPALDAVEQSDRGGPYRDQGRPDLETRANHLDRFVGVELAWIENLTGRLEWGFFRGIGDEPRQPSDP